MAQISGGRSAINVNGQVLKCPKCGNQTDLKMGTMKIESGRITVSDPECLRCGNKDFASNKEIGDGR